MLPLTMSRFIEILTSFVFDMDICCNMISFDTDFFCCVCCERETQRVREKKRTHTPNEIDSLPQGRNEIKSYNVPPLHTHIYTHIYTELWRTVSIHQIS